MRTFAILFVICLALVGVAACSNPAAPDNQAPRVNQFTASPMIVKAGDPVTLSWVIEGPHPAVTIAPGVTGTFDSTGSTVVKPLVTTTYTLTAQNPYGTAQGKLTVAVTK